MKIFSYIFILATIAGTIIALEPKTINSKYWNLSHAEFTCRVTVRPEEKDHLNTYETRVKFGRGGFRFLDTTDPANIFINLFNILTPSILSDILPTDRLRDAQIIQEANAITYRYKEKGNLVNLRYNIDDEGRVTQITQSRLNSSLLVKLQYYWETVNGRFRLNKIDYFRKEADMILEETLQLSYSKFGDVYVPKEIRLAMKTPIINTDDIIDFTKCEP
jgi:hypothetical protein